MDPMTFLLFSTCRRGGGLGVLTARFGFLRKESAITESERRKRLRASFSFSQLGGGPGGGIGFIFG